MKERMKKIIHIMGGTAALTILLALPVYADAKQEAQPDIKTEVQQEVLAPQAQAVEEAKAQEPKAQEPKAQEPKAQEPEAQEPQEQPEEASVTLLEADAWTNKVAASVTTCANIRSEATTESDRLGVLPRAGVADVVEHGEEWTRIQSGEITGYIRNDLLVFAQGAKELYEEVHGITGTVTVPSLRVRGEASLEAEPIDAFAEGQKVNLTGAEGEWYTVEGSSEDEAYMYKEYITIDEPQQIAMTEEEYYIAQQEQEQQAAAEVATEAVSASASNGELALLAAIIQCEAGGESYEGKVAVGAVIMNRMRSGSFPDSITDVVYQGGQFSPVASGGLAGVLSQGARDDCYEAAQAALNGENPVGGSLYFNSGSGRGIQIGNQHFY